MATTRAEEAVKLFESGMNCAQSVFCAFGDELGMDAEIAAKVSCGLGGGVGRLREVCGAVTGAAMVIGMRSGPDKNKVYPLVQEFAEKFKAERGSIVCRELLSGTDAGLGGQASARTPAFYRTRPCAGLVKLAASLLEEGRSAFAEP